MHLVCAPIVNPIGVQEICVYKRARDKNMVKVFDADAEGWDEVCRRTAGRRRYNKRRQLLAELRRYELAKLFAEHDPFEWGSRKKFAEELQVSEATISRDIAKLIERANRRDKDSPAAWRRRWAFGG
jgi:hypothetical protein